MSGEKVSSPVTLRQRVGLLGQHTFTLTDDGVLFSFKSPGKHREYVLPYAIMSPKFTRSQSFPAGWLLASALVLMLAASQWVRSIHLKLTKPGLDFGPAALLCGITTGAGLFLLLKAFQKWWHTVLVPHRYTGGTVLALDARRPSVSAVDGFLKHLEQRLSGSISPESAGSRSLSAQLEQLSHLHEEGALTAEEFQQAKEKVLGRERPLMGFGPPRSAEGEGPKAQETSESPREPDG